MTTTGLDGCFVPSSNSEALAHCLRQNVYLAAVEEEAMSSSESLVGDSTTYSVAPTLADIDSDKVSSVTQASVQPASDANDKISVAEKSIKVRWFKILIFCLHMLRSLLTN